MFDAKWRIASTQMNKGTDRLKFGSNVTEQKLEFALDMISTMHSDANQARESFLTVHQREQHLQGALHAKNSRSQELQRSQRQLETENRALQRKVQHADATVTASHICCLRPDGCCAATCSNRTARAGAQCSNSRTGTGAQCRNVRF